MELGLYLLLGCNGEDGEKEVADSFNDCYAALGKAGDLESGGSKLDASDAAVDGVRCTLNGIMCGLASKNHVSITMGWLAFEEIAGNTQNVVKIGIAGKEILRSLQDLRLARATTKSSKFVAKFDKALGKLSGKGFMEELTTINDIVGDSKLPPDELKQTQKAKRKQLVSQKFGAKTKKIGAAISKMGRPGKLAGQKLVKYASKISKVGGKLLAGLDLGLSIWSLVEAGKKINKGSDIAKKFEKAIEDLKKEKKNLRLVFRDILKTIDCIEVPGTCTKMTISVEPEKAKRMTDIIQIDRGLSLGMFYIKISYSELDGSEVSDLDPLIFDIREDYTITGALNGIYNITLEAKGNSMSI